MHYLLIRGWTLTKPYLKGKTVDAAFTYLVGIITFFNVEFEIYVTVQ